VIADVGGQWHWRIPFPFPFTPASDTSNLWHKIPYEIDSRFKGIFQMAFPVHRRNFVRQIRIAFVNNHLQALAKNEG
jgi:hypothetical protein